VKSIKTRRKPSSEIPRRFGLTILDLAKKRKIVGITPSGSSLKFMMDALPERAFDVGIEQHAVTLSAGMATQGMVVFATSTPLTRGYDQVIHDSHTKLTRYFCLDRAGLVGRRNPSRRFDLAYLRCIPNMIIYSPLSEIGLQNILYTARLRSPNSHPLSSWSWCSTGLANQEFWQL
jgi:1-deoxy-D-xylulose-5-phosphate synthase